jgi:hypothetical protein
LRSSRSKTKKIDGSKFENQLNLTVIVREDAMAADPKGCNKFNLNLWNNFKESIDTIQ